MVRGGLQGLHRSDRGDHRCGAAQPRRGRPGTHRCSEVRCGAVHAVGSRPVGGVGDRRRDALRCSGRTVGHRSGRRALSAARSGASTNGAPASGGPASALRGVHRCVRGCVGRPAARPTVVGSVEWLGTGRGCGRCHARTPGSDGGVGRARGTCAVMGGDTAGPRSARMAGSCPLAGRPHVGTVRRHRFVDALAATSACGGSGAPGGGTGAGGPGVAAARPTVDRSAHTPKRIGAATAFRRHHARPAHRGAAAPPAGQRTASQASMVRRAAART